MQKRIHSAIKDNWNRVEIMHNVAHGIYATTLEGDFRVRLVNQGKLFPFHPAILDSMESESHIVGMVKAWSVIAIESLANHQIAETFKDFELAVRVIESPNPTRKELEIGNYASSELATKLIILSNQLAQNYDLSTTEVVKTADDIVEIRNSIVHDKPYELSDNGEGEFDTREFRRRGKSEVHRFESLAGFYGRCDMVKDFITGFNASIEYTFDFSFAALSTSQNNRAETSQ